MPKKMFGLHKDVGGAVVGAFEFGDSYDLSQRIRALDIHDGDWIDFKTVAERKSADADEVQSGPPLRKANEPLTPLPVGDEQPF